MIKAKLKKHGDGRGDGFIGGWSIEFDPPIKQPKTRWDKATKTRVPDGFHEFSGIMSDKRQCLKTAEEAGIKPDEIELV